MTSKTRLETREHAILAEMDRRNPSLAQGRRLLEKQAEPGAEYDPNVDTSTQQAAALLAELDDDEVE